jgi:hypothetical protein
MRTLPAVAICLWAILTPRVEIGAETRFLTFSNTTDTAVKVFLIQLEISKSFCIVEIKPRSVVVVRDVEIGYWHAVAFDIGRRRSIAQSPLVLTPDGTDGRLTLEGGPDHFSMKPTK